MDKMNDPKEIAVMRGISNVYTGLGMLLGAGRISAATHDHILSLITDELAPELKENDGEKPPMGHLHPRKEPPPVLANPKRTVANSRWEDLKTGGGRKSGAGSVKEGSTETRGTWHSAIPETSLSSPGGGGDASEPPVANVVCPWYSTAGYHCREQRQGRCAWLHESSPGAVTEPLICSFWAENLCNKTAEDCRFAHYWAQHRQIAPSPSTKFKRPSHVAKPGWS